MVLTAWPLYLSLGGGGIYLDLMVIIHIITGRHPRLPFCKYVPFALPPQDSVRTVWSTSVVYARDAKEMTRDARRKE